MNQRKEKKPAWLRDIEEKVIGLELIGVEHNPDGESNDCGEEVILHFTNGKEINIYVHPENGLTVEED